MMRKFILNILNKIYLHKYDDFTVAQHFRRQGARIGGNNRLEIRSLGSEPYLVSIANHCTVAANVKFLTHDGGVWVFTETYPDLQKFGPITILDNCFIGIDSIIMGNVIIGPNSIVGAGSVVTKNVPGNTIVAGNPARSISSLEQYKEKALNIWRLQKPLGYFVNPVERGALTAEDIQRTKSRDLALLRAHLLAMYGQLAGEGDEGE